ncbi:2Fe-2S iron-sulfur cluster-binding protein [Modestobacter versicolor]|uniref:2Fe-2S iron-sulfur cluster-binding protein n=1 Tax=Modestobacter versicolor TaxID=429133 RepID=UPI0034DF18EF
MSGSRPAADRHGPPPAPTRRRWSLRGARATALVPDVALEVDGRPVPATSGQSLLAALVAAGAWSQRLHPVTGRPEAGICGMGTCQACVVTVAGRGAVRACGTEVEDGLQVTTAAGRERSR